MPTLGVVIAQLPVTDAVESNVAALRRAVTVSVPGDIVVAPEGFVSGYSTEVEFFRRIDPDRINAALDDLSQLAVQCRISLCVGTCLLEADKWSNVAVLLAPTGERDIYRKVNLATSERGLVHPGNALTTYTLRTPCPEVQIRIQICRELRFPDQWRVLAEAGAQAIIHLDNAIGDGDMREVWRSHLVSRAAENQRFVVSANNAAPGQNAPSLAIHPSGTVLTELEEDESGVERVELVLDDVSDYYLGQRRRDLT